MLILKRNLNEKIFITTGAGEIITLQVTELVGPGKEGRGFVRFGFDAPPSVRIVREDAIKKEPKKSLSEIVSEHLTGKETQ